MLWLGENSLVIRTRCLRHPISSADDFLTEFYSFQLFQPKTCCARECPISRPTTVFSPFFFSLHLPYRFCTSKIKTRSEWNISPFRDEPTELVKSSDFVWPCSSCTRKKKVKVSTTMTITTSSPMNNQMKNDRYLEHETWPKYDLWLWLIAETNKHIFDLIDSCFARITVNERKVVIVLICILVCCRRPQHNILIMTNVEWDIMAADVTFYIFDMT